MASGRINIGSCTSYGVVNYTWYIDWTSTSNVGANTSNVTGIFYVEKMSTKNNTVYDSVVNATCTINGTVFRNSSFKWDMRSHGVGSRVEICRGTVNNIPHNSDGSKSISMSAYFPTETSTAGIQSGSGTAKLDTIPRASIPTLSASSIQIGNTVTINTNRASSSFTHTVYFSFGNISWRTIATGVGASVNFTLPTDMLNQIPNSTSGTGTIILRTFSNGASIGDKTIGFTATVGGNIVPSITNVLTESDTTVNGIKLYILGKSKCKVSTAYAGIYGSTITKVNVNCIGVNYNGSSVWTNVLNKVGDQTITVTITDSRGRTASTTRTISILSYSNPVISTATALRCNADGTINDTGDNIKITFVGSVSTLDNKNAKSFGAELWNGNTKVTDLYWSSDSYSINVSEVHPYIDINKSYIVKFKANDWFTATTKDVTIPTAFTLMDIKGSGRGMAFGKVAEIDNLIDYGMPIKIGGGLANKYHLGAGANFNDCITDGVGYVGTSDGVGITNAPYTGNIYGKLIVIVSTNYTHDNSTNWVWQYFMDTSGNIYTRWKVNNGGWSSWYQIPITRNVSGRRWDGGAVTVYTNGITNIGKYLDFHVAFNSEYYEARIQANSSQFHVNLHWSPLNTGTQYNGVDAYRWKQLYSVSAPNVSSDRTLKYDITYLNNKTKSSKINYTDCFNFVKDDLELATYKFKNDTEEKMNFIAQDLLVNSDGSDNKVGQFIVNPISPHTEEEKVDIIANLEEGQEYNEPKLGYDMGNYISVLAGALKEAIVKIEVQDKRILELEQIIKGGI